MLEVGDVACGDIVIERKEAGDFVGSIIDGRLNEQAAKMSLNYDHKYVIIEGNPFRTDSNINPHAIIGKMVSLLVKHDMKIIFVETPTQFVFACSRFAIQAKWVLASMFAAFIGCIAWSIFSDKGRLQSRKVLLRLPMMRDLLAKVALTRFFRSASTLIEGGLPALFALQQASTSLRHPLLERSIHDALQCLSEGQTLQKAMQGRPFIPPLVPRMLGIAQEGGNLASMMNQIASIYEEDLEKALTRITSLAQPILLLALGAMVGFVLLSVLLPMTDVGTFAT